MHNYNLTFMPMGEGCLNKNESLYGRRFPRLRSRLNFMRDFSEVIESVWPFVPTAYR